MQPFVIQCTTCRARLKVSDAVLVGDIVECPKCSSFVEVSPPAGWQPPTAGATSVNEPPVAAPPVGSNSGSSSISIPVSRDRQRAASDGAQSSAVRKAAAAALAPPPLPPKSNPAAVSAAPAGKSTAVKSTAAKSAVGSSTITNKGAITKSAASLIVPDLPAEPGVLTHLWQGARQHYWISVGSLSSLLAVVAIAWLASGSKTEPVPAAGESAPVADARSAEDPLGSNDREPVADNHVGDATGNRTEGDVPDSAQPSGTLAEKDDQKDSSEQASPTESSVTGSTVPVAEAKPQAAKEPRAGTPASSGIDPLDPVVRALATEPEPLSSTNPGLPPPVVPGDPTSDQMTSTDPSAADDSDASTASAGSTGDMASTEEFDGTKQARMVAHLQDQLPSIDFKDVPLDQFVTFLSELSTVPIVLDADSLAQAGKGPKTKITVKLAGGAVQDALKSALAKPGLMFHVEPKRVVITAGTPKR